MNTPQFLYLLSISFQLSGALILIFYCWGEIENKVINKIFPSNSSIERQDDNTVVINKNKLRKAYKEIWLNRIAFICLGTGYLLTVFGNNEGLNTLCVFFMVGFSSCVIMCIGVGASDIIAKLHSKENVKYDYTELKLMIDADLSTNTIKSEIEEITNK